MRSVKLSDAPHRCGIDQKASKSGQLYTTAFAAQAAARLGKRAGTHDTALINGTALGVHRRTNHQMGIEEFTNLKKLHCSRREGCEYTGKGKPC